MVRPGSGRFGLGFWVGFWVGLRARDFPTERVLSRTTLIIRTVDQSKLLGLLDYGEFGAWSKGLHAIAQINSLKRPNKSAVVAFSFSC